MFQEVERAGDQVGSLSSEVTSYEWSTCAPGQTTARSDDILNDNDCDGELIDAA